MNSELKVNTVLLPPGMYLLHLKTYNNLFKVNFLKM